MYNSTVEHQGKHIFMAFMMIYLTAHCPDIHIELCSRTLRVHCR